MMRRIGSVLAAAFVLSCTAPAMAGWISINPASDPVSRNDSVVCKAAALGCTVAASSSSVVWPHSDGASARSPFAGTSIDARRSLIQLIQLASCTVDGYRDTDYVARHRPTRTRAYSLDDAVDCSALMFPAAGEDVRTGPVTFISLLGSPARG